MHICLSIFIPANYYNYTDIINIGAVIVYYYTIIIISVFVQELN